MQEESQVIHLFEETATGQMGEEGRALVEEYYLAHHTDVIDYEMELKASRDSLNNLLNSISEIMVMGDRPTPRPTYILDRGLYDAPSGKVEAGTPEAILGFS